MRYDYTSAGKHSPGRKKRKRGLLLSLAALLAVTGALTLDSNLHLTVSAYDLSYANLPPAFEGFKIIALSDLHGRSYGRDNEKLAAKVAAQTPDLIVLTGDFIDSAGDIPTVEALCRQLTEIAPVYFASGNHDWGSGRISDLAQALEDCGVTYLRNSYVPLERDGSSIVLAGVEDPNSWAEMLQPDQLAEQIARERPGSFVILLGHRNYWPEEYPQLPVDLIFSGHAHGGVIRLPGIGGLLGTDHRLFPDNVDGVVRCGRYNMVVSRGLAGVWILPRFLNNPEIVSVTLHSAEK